MRYFLKKFIAELVTVIAFVVAGTWIAYWNLVNIGPFWDAQKFWSVALMICWTAVSFGYYHQGWIIHRDQSTEHVSKILPVTVLLVQCILFVKGIFYHDWSLVVGAVLVNSGVIFYLYQIWQAKK